MKKNCIFISAGDKERFASYALEKMRDDYDIIINFYGKDLEKKKKFESLSSKLLCYKTTKFISLKLSYDELIRNKYDWVAVFDDDALFISGSMNDLFAAGETYGLDLVSGCHSGKISHFIHISRGGSHKIRYVNFVEMNFPVFNNKALSSYMEKYDGKLCGWGNDWWYCNILKTNQNKNAAILDSVVIENKRSNNEMNSFMDWEKREQQWEETKLKFSLEEWDQKTIGFL